MVEWLLRILSSTSKNNPVYQYVVVVFILMAADWVNSILFHLQEQRDDLDLLNDETFGVSDDVSELNDGNTFIKLFFKVKINTLCNVIHEFCHKVMPKH